MTNLAQRLIVAAAGIPLLLFLSYQGGVYLLSLVAVISLLGMWEFSKIAQANQARIPWQLLGLLLVMVEILVFLQKWSVLVLTPLLGILLLCLYHLPRPNEESARGLAFSFLGLIYLSQLLAWLLIRELPQTAYLDYGIGGLYIIALFLLVWSCDTAAYFGGKTLGKHKLAPQISPGKTVEGAIFGLVGALLVTPLVYQLLGKHVRLRDLLVMGALVGTVGQTGDLIESLLKRSAQMKDTSVLLPGHGGVLDRFDSLLFVAPWVYVYLRWQLLGN